MAVNKEFRVSGLRVNSSANVITSLGVGTTLDVVGAATFLGAIAANSTVTISTVSNANTFRVLAGTNGLTVSANMGAANINPMVVAGDVLIYSSNSTINTSNLTIGTYTNRAGGFGLRFSSPAYSITFAANTVVLGSAGLSANGSFGTATHVLTSNGSATYWAAAAGGVSSVSTGVGLTGGDITSAGTVSVVANNGLSANSTGVFVVAGSGAVSNSTGIHVNANNGITANTTGVFAKANTGLVANSTGIHVLAANGITANSTGVFVARYNNAGGLLFSGGGLYVASSNGLSSAGDATVYVIAGNGLIANTTGVHVKANTGITANSSGLFAASPGAPTLRHVTGGYTSGGQVFVASTQPTASAAGDIWIQI